MGSAGPKPFGGGKLLADGTAARAAERDAPARARLAREGISVEFILDAGIAARVVARIASDGAIGIDIETAKLAAYGSHPNAGLDPHMSAVRLVQIYAGGATAYVFDIRSTGLSPLAPLWQRPMVAHNAVFELKHLRHAGIRLSRLDCTMLMANAVDGRLPSLRELAHTELSSEISKDEQVSNWDAPELTEGQICYAALDAVLAWRLAGRLGPRLQGLGRMRLYELMRGAQEAIADMELTGLHFDRDHHADLMRKWECAKEKSQCDLRAQLGPTVNPSSHVQLGRWLKAALDKETLATWPRTKRGMLRFDADTLAGHADHPLVRPLLEYKEASKRLSGFGERYAAHISPATGRIHATFRSGGTATGRISCRSPNVQNPPRDPAFRALFSTPAGRALVVADYSQIELRVAALISGDRRMMDAYIRGEDLHRATAAAVLGVDPTVVTTDERQAAKAVNFGLLFGQRPNGLARYAAANYGVQMSVADAERAHAVFFKTYPGLAEWQRHIGQAGRREGRVCTPAGRVRRLSLGPYGYSRTEALNTPIQGGAAEVMLAALCALPRRLDGLDAVLVNVVHDEVVVEVCAAEAEQARQAVEAAMIEGMHAIFPNAPVEGLVQAKIGRNWADAK